MYAPVHFLAAVLLTQIIDNVPGKVVEDNPNAQAAASMWQKQRNSWLFLSLHLAKAVEAIWGGE